MKRKKKKDNDDLVYFSKPFKVEFEENKIFERSLVRPHKCPVCEGIGEIVSPLIKLGAAAPGTLCECPACKGTGVLWG